MATTETVDRQVRVREMYIKLWVLVNSPEMRECGTRWVMQSEGPKANYKTGGVVSVDVTVCSLPLVTKNVLKATSGSDEFFRNSKELVLHCLCRVHTLTILTRNSRSSVSRNYGKPLYRPLAVGLRL